MFGLSWGEIILIMIVALIFIGPKKLPDLAKMIGKGLREFRKATSEIENEIDKEEEYREAKWKKDEVKKFPLPQNGNEKKDKVIDTDISEKKES